MTGSRVQHRIYCLGPRNAQSRFPCGLVRGADAIEAEETDLNMA